MARRGSCAELNNRLQWPKHRVRFGFVPVLASARTFLHFRLRATRRLCGMHARAGLKFVLAIYDDSLAGFETLVNQRHPAFDLRNLQRPYLDRLVVLDDKRERALRPALNHRSGNNWAVFARGEQKAGVD